MRARIWLKPEALNAAHTPEVLERRAKDAVAHWMNFGRTLCESVGAPRLPDALAVELRDDCDHVSVRVPAHLGYGRVLVRRSSLVAFPRQIIGEVLPYYMAYLFASVLKAPDQPTAQEHNAMLRRMGKHRLSIFEPAPAPRRQPPLNLQST